MNITRYIQNVVIEAKNIRWLPLYEASRLTLLVVIISFIMGFLIGITDNGIAHVVQYLITLTR